MTSSPTRPTLSSHITLGARDWGKLIPALCPIAPPFPHSAEALAQHRIMGFSSPPSAKLIAPRVVTEPNLDSQRRRLKPEGKDWAAEFQPLTRPGPPLPPAGLPHKGRAIFQSLGSSCPTSESDCSPEERGAGWSGWRRGELVPVEGIRAHHGKVSTLIKVYQLCRWHGHALGTGPRGGAGREVRAGCGPRAPAAVTSLASSQASSGTLRPS